MSQFLSSKYLKYRGLITGGSIDRDQACTSCGYNLRGLVFGRPCPECGVPARPSSEAISLIDAPLPVIVGFRLGMWAALGCIPALSGLPYLATSIAGLHPNAVTIVAVALAGVWTWGCWRLTSVVDVPDAGRYGFARTDRLRLAARWGQFIWPLWALCLGLGFAFSWWLYGLGVVGVVLLSAHLIRLASWTSDELAGRHFNRAAWGLAISLPGVALAMWFVPFMVFGCSFVVIWLVSWVFFLLGMLTLSRSIRWCVVNARQQMDRQRRLAAQRQHG